ncbi:DNA alkylation repair protein [Paenibacillus sp. YAF4_2]|uniref:DNA alkylation repair protein n=1 Tax=Paenibacillus sp. YAF4_2 TaxID=3233085 RepID=UPI003F9E3900
MSTHTRQLAEWLGKHANPENARSMEAYMRNQFPFLGLKTPERKQLTREFWKEHGLPKGELLLQTVSELWQLPEREYQYTAMVLLDKHRKQAERSHIEVLERLVVTKSWWDTVDIIAGQLIGFHLSKYPELLADYPDRWIHSENMWLRRTAILYQLKYKGSTDTDRLFHYIDLQKEESEFFIRKAIGWALREYAKTEPDVVRRFVNETPISSLSVREALKHIGKE